MAAEAYIRLQAPEGKWETVGVERYAGVEFEGLQLAANPVGSDTCSFTLKRPVDVPHPDLSAFTPCEVWVEGQCVWEGRVRETPNSDTEGISVTGAGWQYHLDDDLIERMYVHSDLTQWKDARTFATANLSINGVAGATAGQDDFGAITIGWPKGAQIGANTPANPTIGVVLDLGPDPRKWARRVICDVRAPTRTGSINLIVFSIRGQTSENFLAGGSSPEILQQGDFTSITTSATATTPFGGNFSKPYRYVALLAISINAAAWTTGEDDILQIPNVLVFPDPKFESGRASIVRASDIISDISNYTPKLTLPSITSAKWDDEADGTPNLAVRYKLQETSGTSLFDTGRDPSKTATITGTATLTPSDSLIDGEVNQGTVAFAAGASAKATTNLPSSFKLPSMFGYLMEVVFKPTGLPANAAIMAMGTLSTDGAFLWVSGTGGSDPGATTGARLWVRHFAGGAGTSNYNTGVDLVNGTIYHIAFARDRLTGNLYVYVNGSRVFAATPSTAPASPTAGFQFGSVPGVYDDVLLGSEGFQPDDTNIGYSDRLPGLKYQAARSKQKGDVQRTGLNFPQFVLDGVHTPRDFLDGANAPHRYRLRVVPGTKYQFGPMPNAPLYKVGDWGGAIFQDASSGSGDEIYSKVIVTGQDAWGNPVRVTRSSSQQSAAVLSRSASPQPSNPDFEVNASGWLGNSIARTTAAGTFDTGVGGLAVSGIAGGAAYAAATSMTSPLIPGATYRLTFRIKLVTGSSKIVRVGLADTSLADPSASGAYIDFDGSALGWGAGFNTVVADIPCAATALGGPYAPWIGMPAITSATVAFDLDNVELQVNWTTLVDRQGFLKAKELPISNVLTTAMAQKLGDAFLSNHLKTPLKGSLSVQPGGVRTVLGDRTVHPSELLLGNQELMRLSHRVDPDTGALGRDGIIANVTYDHTTETSSVSIDNDRQNFDTLLQRMAVVITQQ